MSDIDNQIASLVVIIDSNIDDVISVMQKERIALPSTRSKYLALKAIKKLTKHLRNLIGK